MRQDLKLALTQTDTAFQQWKRDVAKAWDRVCDELPTNKKGRLVVNYAAIPPRPSPEQKHRLADMAGATIYLSTATLVGCLLAYAAIVPGDGLRVTIAGLVVGAAEIAFFTWAGRRAFARASRGVWKPREAAL